LGIPWAIAAGEKHGNQVQTVPTRQILKAGSELGICWFGRRAGLGQAGGWMQVDLFEQVLIDLLTP